MLRPYQQRTLDQFYAWFQNHTGWPCIVMPTGSGKSHIIAELCKDAISKWPETRVLMLSHVRELIEQNASKLLAIWPEAPLGIYSAGMGRKELNQITFAGIQSLAGHEAELGHTDLIIVDENHLISHNENGRYRTLILKMKEINPNMCVCGLTATPYRLGHGLITEKPAIFSDIIEPVSIEELIYHGYLSPLRSKHTQAQLDVRGVAKRGGEFIEKELQHAVNTTTSNAKVVEETLLLATDRRSLLYFCCGVAHANAIRDILSELGESCACITGATPKGERDEIIQKFRAGEIRHLTNANVLTTGFDAPNLDCIVMLRPTESPGLHCQMAGRGMRVKEHVKDCLFLDFAGNVSRHGPITNVQPPIKHGKRTGKAPVKVCEQCNELVHLSAKVCPSCGYEFPVQPKVFKLHDDDIMGDGGLEMDVTGWRWDDYVSRGSGKNMLRVTYYGNMSDTPITEYLPVTHEGRGGDMGRHRLMKMAMDAGVSIVGNEMLIEIACNMTKGKCPSKIKYKKNGKFYEVTRRIYLREMQGPIVCPGINCPHCHFVAMENYKIPPLERDLRCICLRCGTRWSVEWRSVAGVDKFYFQYFIIKKSININNLNEFNCFEITK